MIFAVEEQIKAPVDTVWRHLTEPRLMARWMPGLSELRTPDGGPLEADSQLLFTSRGQERTSQVVAYRPNQELVLRSVQGPITATYRYRLASNGGVTRIKLEADCVARGWAKLIAPLIRPLIRRADGGQLAALRETVTSG